MERRAPGWADARRVAVGGMAEIWLATAPGGKAVAIKRLLPALADRPDFVEAFVEEARLVGLLDHPNILRVVDLGIDEEPWLAVEWVDGVDLARVGQALRSRGMPAPLGLLALVARDLLAALDHVHGARDAAGRPLQLVHRDVSPHNLLIGRDGVCTLIDFGVARSGEPAPAGRLAGKVAYLAPEQIEGRPLDHRVDVFAAGVVLYELATGRHPFLAGCEGATLRATALARPAPPSSLRAELPARFSAAILHALAPRPEDRFPSARELADVLAAALPPALAPADVARLLAELFPEGLPHELPGANEREEAGDEPAPHEAGLAPAPLGRVRLVRALLPAGVADEAPEVEIIGGEEPDEEEGLPSTEARPVAEAAGVPPGDAAARVARAAEDARPNAVAPTRAPDPAPGERPRPVLRRAGHAAVSRPRPETRPDRPPVLFPAAAGPPAPAAERDGGAGLR